MGSGDDEISLKMSAQLDDLAQGLITVYDQIDDTFTKVAEQIDALSGKVSKSADEVKEHASKMAEGFKGIYEEGLKLAAVWLSFEGAKKVIEIMAEADAANSRLSSQFKATGENVGLSLQRIREYSEELSKLDGINSGVVKSAEAILLTYTRVRGEGFERTLKAAADLAAVQRTDLVSATHSLGRALQEPEQGMTILRRAGISLSESQQMLIRDFVAAGEKAKAAEIILAEVEKRYRGAGEAAANTLGGALTTLKNKFADLFEGAEHGSDPATKAVKELTDVISDPKVKEAMNTLVAGFATLLGFLTKVATGLVLVLKGPQDRIQQIDDQIKELDYKIGKLNIPPAMMNAELWQRLNAASVLDLTEKRNKLLREQQVLLGLGAPATKAETDQYGGPGKQKDENKKPETLGPTPEEIEERRRAQITAAIAAEQTELRLMQQGSIDKVRVAMLMTQQIGDLYGRNSDEYRAALQQQAQISLEYGQQQVALAIQVAEGRRAADLNDLTNEAARIKAQFDLRQISAQDYIRLEQDIVQKKLEANERYYGQLAILRAADEKEQLRIQQELQEATQKATRENIQIQSDAMKRIQGDWEKLMRPVVDAFADGIDAMRRKTLTFEQAVRDVFDSVVKNIIRTTTQSVAKWIATEHAKTAATVVGASTRAAVEESAHKKGLIASAAAGLKEIFNAAYVAAANVYKSVAAIPYVGWVLAPIAAAATFAVVAGYGAAISSAKGGMWEVGGDQLAQIHNKESVLPANIAEPMRKFFAEGNDGKAPAGGGGRFDLRIIPVDRDHGLVSRRELSGLIRQLNNRFAL